MKLAKSFKVGLTMMAMALEVCIDWHGHGDGEMHMLRTAMLPIMLTAVLAESL